MANIRGKFEKSFPFKMNSSDPFWATHLWQMMIHQVKTNVKVGRHRYLLKQFDDVFSGNSLVDVVFSFLGECSFEVISQNVTRKNATKVCQVLMENKLFECVTPKGLMKFEDSSLRLYRFPSDEVNSSQDSSDCSKENRKVFPSFNPSTSQFVTTNDISDKEVLPHCSDHISRKVMQELNGCSLNDSNLDKSCPTKPKSSLHYENQWISPLDLSPQRKLIRQKSTRKSLSRSRAHNLNSVKLTNHVSKTTDDMLEDKLSSFKEAAFAHLLSLIDVPVLESILSVPENLSKTTSSGCSLIIENNSLKGIKENIRFLDLSQISWIKAATSCTSSRPNGIDNLWSVQACKIHCYKSVVEYYSKVAECIVPESYMCVCTSIINLLKESHHEKALHSLQLLMIILPLQRREELQSLLKFLLIVTEDIFVNVDRKLSNHDAVSRDFMHYVFSHPLVAKEHCQVLFDFMVFKVASLFDIPLCLENINSFDLRFCERIESENLEAITLQCTTNSLQQLAFSIMDSTKIQLKEKKMWLKKFSKIHPEVYTKCMKE